ncbi:hypothetical protein ACFFX1_10465 [Dactylosporangium sucinum]|nr:hypothetical protein [Dactylosporangium sucinum]
MRTNAAAIQAARRAGVAPEQIDGPARRVSRARRAGREPEMPGGEPRTSPAPPGLTIDEVDALLA